MKTTLLLTVNETEIICVEKESDTLVPIAPICISLGLKTKHQLDLLKRNESLNKFIQNETIEYNGLEFTDVPCLPIKWIFGWLFTIKNVKNYDGVMNIYNSIMDFVKAQKEK